MITKDGSIVALRTMMQLAALDMQIRLAKDVAIGIADADLVIGNLTQADFIGYAAKPASALPNPALNAANQAESDSGTLTWTAGAIAGAQTCYMVYVTMKDWAGDVKLYGVGRFTQPQTVTLQNDTILAQFNFFAWNGNP